MKDESKSLMELLNDLAPSLDSVPSQLKGTTMSIIDQRAKTHGEYKNTAAWSQSLKDMFRGSPNWAKMNDGQKEAMEMIAVKLARLLNGDPNFANHPVDVGGYAELYASSIDLASVRDAQRITDDLAKSIAPPSDV